MAGTRATSRSALLLEVGHEGEGGGGAGSHLHITGGEPLESVGVRADHTLRTRGARHHPTRQKQMSRVASDYTAYEVFSFGSLYRLWVTYLNSSYQAVKLIR
jgi:hypothetical protein